MIEKRQRNFYKLSKDRFNDFFEKFEEKLNQKRSKLMICKLKIKTLQQRFK